MKCVCPSCGITHESSLWEQLTPRHQEIVQLLFKGVSEIKEIAKILNITSRTVKAHLGHMYKMAEIDGKLYYSKARLVFLLSKERDAWRKGTDTVPETNSLYVGGRLQGDRDKETFGEVNAVN
jgi:DNA-binding CsgD family transcriptional regulator